MQKSLTISRGMRHLQPIVETAHKMGMYVITAEVAE